MTRFSRGEPFKESYRATWIGQSIPAYRPRKLTPKRLISGRQAGKDLRYELIFPISEERMNLVRDIEHTLR
jgi:hypothetical protein